LRNARNGLDLHLGAGAAAIAGMVVGIDDHGQCIGGSGHGMRRLEHLPGIKGMEIGVIVGETVGGCGQNAGDRLCVEASLKGRERCKLRVKQLGGAGEQTGNRIRDHGDLPH